MREDALAAWRAGVAAADPSAAVSRALQRPRNTPWRDARLVVAIGKAAASMMRGAGAVARGLVLLPDGVDAGRLPRTVEVLRGGHPVPTPEGIETSRRVVAEVERLQRGDRLLVLISGGASSLFEVPRAGIGAASVIEAYRALLACGAAIHDVNRVRRALSAVKGGGLARAAGAARVLTLAVSDVADDDPATIGSGPTVPVDDDARDVLDVAMRHGLVRRFSRDVRELLEAAARVAASPPSIGRVQQSGSAPRCARGAPARDGRAERAVASPPGRFEVVCSATRSVAAARAELRVRGYRVAAAASAAHGAPARLEGDAADAASRVAAAIASVLDAAAKRTAFVVAGETTVTLPAAAAGRGGRNQHLAAVVATRLAGRPGFACLAAGTDGVDGTSDFAGALVDGGTAARAAHAGYDLESALARFDTSTALERAGDALRTGPTGTNVGDLLVAVVASG